MNRNFKHLNSYLNQLYQDIYPQPIDSGHFKLALGIFNKWIRPNFLGVSVLDVGCGDTAFMKPVFERKKMAYTGIALNSSNPNVINMDFSFLDFPDESFDLIFSRHSLEHSPMPLLTLMEWYRVAKDFLCLVLPNPQHYGYVGINHYSVMNKEQVNFLLKRAGWNIIWEDNSEPTEIRLMCEKLRDKIYE